MKYDTVVFTHTFGGGGAKESSCISKTFVVQPTAANVVMTDTQTGLMFNRV